MFVEVLLAANAIKNQLERSPTVSVTPRPSHNYTVSKSMITNASFRTKKLPGKTIRWMYYWPMTEFSSKISFFLNFKFTIVCLVLFF